MATQRRNDRKNKRVERPTRTTTGVKSSKPSAQPDIPIKSLVPARYIINGEVSGTRYEWNGSDSVTLVKAEDAEAILAKRSPRACCSGGGKNVMFIISE